MTAFSLVGVLLATSRCATESRNRSRSSLPEDVVGIASMKDMNVSIVRSGRQRLFRR